MSNFDQIGFLYGILGIEQWILDKIYVLYQSSHKRQIRRIFTPTFGFVRINVPAWDSDLLQTFFLLTCLKLLKNTPR